MAYPLLANTPGETHLLLGNEAIVRGALEAGVRFVSCYPGTPSSEVPDTFFRMSAEGDYYFEYSPNEKVALEVAGGAALGGAPTLCTMKHVGVNVAADPLFTLTYIGTPGGLVLLSADDPGCHSSQNEQDNRGYCRMAGMPCFEPATAAEATAMTTAAFELSREYEQPVMLRTTTRVNHVRGPVTFKALPDKVENKPFEKNFRRFVPVPATARVRHHEMAANMETIRKVAETSPFNTVTGSGKIGVVASGVARNYLADAVAGEGWEDKVKVLDLGMSFPLPTELLADFAASVDTVVVVEELEPIVETELRALVQERGIDVKVVGKGDIMTRFGEYSTSIVRAALMPVVTGETAETDMACAPQADLPVRPPNLCAGCSHRATYYAVRKVFGDDALYSSDIGCYTLGLLPPLSAADFLLCMGSSVSAGSGMARVQDKPVVAFIGDSTFFHSGITGLVNAVHNKHDVLVVILDNRTTAMTGHQLNPGVDQEIMGEDRMKVDIEAIVRACGVEHVAKTKPYNLKSTLKVLEEYKALGGVRVILAEDACVLFARRALKRKPARVAYVAEQGPDVEAVLAEFACPAYRKEGDDIIIDDAACAGCMVCLQITDKVKARKRGA